ncbi:hypothetical protein Tco_0995800 [Tanacetum coccineum]
MTSITAQQTKLDLELVPKENRLDIGKCNGRILHGLKPKEETFQVVLDALSLTPVILHFIIHSDVSLKYTCTNFGTVFTSMTTFTDSRLTRRKDSNSLGKSSERSFRFAQECINLGELLLLLSTEAYLERLVVLTNFVFPEHKSFGACSIRSIKEASQIYGAVLPECLTSPEMKESKAYKTYLGHATGVVPPKIARKFKKASPSKKDSIYVQANKEHVQKGKQVKRSAKKSSTTPAVGIVSTEKDSSCVKTMSYGRKRWMFHKEKVQLLKNLQVLKRSSYRHSGRSGDLNRGSYVTGKMTLLNLGLAVENESEEQELISEQDEEYNVDNQEETFLILDAEIVSPLDVHVHHEVPRTQAPTLLPIPVSIITESSPIKWTSLVDLHLDTRLGETRQEFMNFLLESLTARIKEQVKDQLPQILPKKVSNFASPVIDKMIEESQNEVTLAKVSSQPQSTYEAASTLTEFELKKILLDKIEKSESCLTAPEHRDCYDSLKKSYDLDKDLLFSYDVYSLKQNRNDKDKDEDPFAGSDRGLKKRKLSKDAEPTTGPKKKDSMYGSSKGTKSQPKSSRKSVQSEEPVFKVADSDMPHDQEGNLGDNEDEPRKETASRPSTSTNKSLKDFDEFMSTPIDFSGYILNGLKIENLTQEILLGPAFRLLKGTRSNYAELEYDFEECYKALLEKLDWENPEDGDYPFDLSKPLSLITCGNRIEDMVPNIWSPVKVAYDRYALWDTHVKVIRKHGYGYLEEIVVRKADNALYRFKEGDFHDLFYLCIQMEIEALCLLLVVQNWLTNLLGDDIADFAIALRMFTKSLVIQKRVKDLQLRVESYQIRRINVTMPELQDKDIRKRHPYTPYKDPQGFIYVDDHKRNRLMRFDELYKFSDGTLTRLLSSLEDITKNIDMEYVAFDTSAGNPVKDILLKLSLPDYRSILTDSKVTPTNHRRMTKPYSSPRFIANCFNAGYLKMVVKRQSVKVKEIQERCISKAFQDYQIKKGMSMSVQMSQVHEMAKSTRWQYEIILG